MTGYFPEDVRDHLVVQKRSLEPKNQRRWWSGPPFLTEGSHPLFFVPQGVKINKERYIEDILEGALLPWCNSVNGDEVLTFQQDGATSHTARVTQLLSLIHI